MSGVPKVRYTEEKSLFGTTSSNVLIGGRYDALLSSEGHYRLRNGAWSGGGPFYVTHRSLTHRAGAYELKKEFKSNETTQYSSALGSVGCPSLVKPSYAQTTVNAAFGKAMEFSGTGYVNTRPGGSEADLLVALKELLTDGVPTIPFGSVLRGPLKGLPERIRDAIRRARPHQAGGEYLNVVFGWLPLIADLRKLYQLTWKVDAAIRKLVVQNGHRIRRRVVLRDVRTESQTTQSYNYAYANVYGGNGMVNNFAGASTFYTKLQETWERVWYSACYKYWIPNVRSPAWNLRARLALFGALPTPAVLWDAMPWSWLAGWVSDVSTLYDVMSPTAVDNIVQLYGYTMRTVGTRTTCSSTVTYPMRNTWTPDGPFGPQGHKWAGCSSTFTSVYTDVTKVRTGAFSPFGGALSAGLTARQAAVLAALGLTRA